MSADIGYGVLVGAGVLFSTVVGTYVLAYAADRLCSSAVTEHISSPVSNMAGLWGMSPEERKDILEHVFASKQTIRNYNSKKHTASSNDARKKELDQTQQQPVEIEMTEIKYTAEKANTSNSSSSSSNDAEVVASDEIPQELAANDVDLEAGVDGDVVATVATREEQIALGVLKSQELCPESLKNVCAICLVEYEHGDKILNGTGCAHFFHLDCIMEWMKKRHDHCPHCREPMLTPPEMRAGAVEALGRKRVEELSCGATPPMLRPSAPVVVVVTAAASSPAHSATTTSNAKSGDQTVQVAPRETDTVPQNEPKEESATKDETESHDEGSQSHSAEPFSEEVVVAGLYWESKRRK